jgi:hypothetical protein
MSKVATRKIGLEMDARLYAKLSKGAAQNGQSRRFLLERTLEHFLKVVVPAEGTLGPEAMKQFRRSNEKNRKLHQLLAQNAENSDTIAEVISAIVQDVPETEWGKIPPDLSTNLDHYLYGNHKTAE